MGFFMARLQKLRLSTLTVLSDHPVLNQVAQDLLTGVDPAELPRRKIRVFIGLHRKYGLHYLRPGAKISLQTEHYFDADGRAMWRKMKRWRTFRAALFSHCILDLSAANAPHYDFLPGFLRRRVHFGPHIFPSHQPGFTPGQVPGFLFYGEVNDRRQALLDALPEGTARLAPPQSFGADLQRLILAADGVLNLHYAEGRYSEMPRLLSACLAGKAVMSERLGPELEMGRDYLAPGPLPRAEEIRGIYEGFWKNFAALHSFTAFLRRVFG